MIRPARILTSDHDADPVPRRPPPYRRLLDRYTFRDLGRRSRLDLCRSNWRRSLRTSLRQDRLDDLAVYVRQSVVPALELVRQPGVVDAQAVQDRGVQIVNVDRVAL